MLAPRVHPSAQLQSRAVSLSLANAPGAASARSLAARRRPASPPLAAMLLAGRLGRRGGPGGAAPRPPPLLLKSHALPWDFSDDAASTSGSDGGSEPASDDGSWGGGGGDADARAISPTSSGGVGRRAAGAGPDAAAAAELKGGRQPLVCDFKEVSARLKGSATAQVDLQARYRVDPRVVFDLLADPTQHDRIFDAIESADSSLLEEDGPVRRYRLDYRAKWSFWKVSGTCVNKLIMTTDASRGTVAFRLREPGFLRNYEGCWTITGPGGASPCAPAPAPLPRAAPPAAAASLGGRRDGAVAAIARMLSPQQRIAAGPGWAAAPVVPWHPASRHHFQAQRQQQEDELAKRQQQQHTTIITAQCFTTPARTPPPPINQALKAQARSQLEDMLTGLVAAAGRAAEGERREAPRLRVDELRA
ncbi:hypothetical protein Rsub_09429 [Raphidocelis subcapitata]|uniref:Coenzyme Q-binding protein COQ10 START domain-containing protein n=1 Tax=Raphidocelis subcapitata TaxID=307507 RepID=A0A2V0P923_9CHLO|nr:hypothetical protein Rsub_09429 [Raphidocelis subcapitata]|eukprot:GBF96358.1 hypothetical protein Rsub_09429 [Raphidocelis subcapitata]